jgi:hypothetical protein
MVSPLTNLRAGLLIPWLLLGAPLFGGEGTSTKAVHQTFAEERTVNYLAFTPDGKRLIFSEPSRKEKGRLELVLVDPANGNELRRGAPFRHEFNRGFFSPDGKVLVLGTSEFGDPLVWDVERWTIKVRVKPLEGHLGSRTPLAVSPDGNVLLGICQTKDYQKMSLVSWDLGTGAQHILGQEIQEGGAVTKAYFPENGAPYILLEYFRGTDRCLYLWDQAEKKRLPQELVKIQESGRPILAEGLRFALSAGRKVLVFPDYRRRQALSLLGTPGGIITLASRAAQQRWTITDFRGTSFLKQVLSSDGRYLAAYGRDHKSSKPKLAVWDLQGLQKRLRESAPATPRQLDTEWDRLFEAPKVKDDQSPWGYESQLAAHPALRSLVRHPKEAVPWLRKRLGPAATKEDLRQIPQLVKDLDAKDFARRRQATEGLGRVALAARPHLITALSANPSLEKRRRLEEILAKVRGASVLELRMARVLDVLRAIGNADARELLRAIAEGGYGQDFAGPAREVLRRSGKGRPSRD